MKKNLFLSGLMLLLILLVRLLHPFADPPADLSWSGGYYSDEGFWTHNARNAVLFGKAVQDDWNNMFISPLIHFVHLAVFKIFGVGMMQARIPVILISLLSFFFLLLTLRSDFKRADALLGVSLAGFNYILIMYNRLSLLETPILFFIIMSLFLWRKGLRNESRMYFILCGLTLAAAYMTKTTSIFFPASLLFAAYFSSYKTNAERSRIFFTRITYLATGAILPLSIWFFWHYLPHQSFIQAYSDYYRSQQNSTIYGIIKNIAFQPFFIYFARTPVLLYMAWTAVPALVHSLFVKKERGKPVVVAAFFWLLCEAGMLSLFGYRPLRYYLPIIIPMCIISLEWLTALKNENKIMNVNISVVIFFIIWWAVPALEWSGMIAVKFSSFFEPPAFFTNPAIPWTGGAVFLFLTAASAILLILHSKKKFFSDPCFLKAIFMLILTLYALSNGIQYLNWALSPSHDVRDASSDLKKIPDAAVIAGQWAPQLCLCNELQAVPLWKNYVNDENPFQRFQVTHLLSWQYQWGDEYKYHHDWFPDVMARSKKIKTYRIKNSNVILTQIFP